MNYFCHSKLNILCEMSSYKFKILNNMKGKSLTSSKLHLNAALMYFPSATAADYITKVCEAAECIQCPSSWHPYVVTIDSLKNLYSLFVPVTKASCLPYKECGFIWVKATQTRWERGKKKEKASKEEIHHHVSPLPPPTLHLHIAVIRSFSCLMWYGILSPP